MTPLCPKKNPEYFVDVEKSADSTGREDCQGQWQDAIAFAILLVFLVFRPYGVLGRRIRKARI